MRDPLSEVILPSGAKITYTHEQAKYPVGEGKDLPAKADVYHWKTCGVGVPRPPTPDEEPASDSYLFSDGIAERSFTYTDGAGIVRTETSQFYTGLNCAVNPDFTPTNPADWPYDFHYAICDDYAPLIFPEYLWTTVFTHGETPFDPNDPDRSHPNATAEIHRFHAITREEFSVDYVDGDPEAIWGLVAGDNPRAPGIRVLRHVDTQYEVLSENNHPSIFQTAGRYKYVKETVTLTDEKEESIHAEPDGCYTGEVTPDAGLCETTAPGGNNSCTKVSSINEADQYLNITAQYVTFTGQAGVLSQYLPQQAFSYDYRWVDTDWYLHLQASATTTEGEGADTVTRATNREFQEREGESLRKHIELRNETLGESSCGDDCVRHTFLYDDLGNLIADTVSGGYGLGFDPAGVTTVYTYLHGKPASKTLTSGGESLLLWQRDIDPGTQLPRWHLSGNGTGFAYLYGGIGKLTDMAPIEGDFVSGGQGENYWTIDMQTTGGETLYGSRIEYSYPDGGSLLEHRVSDETYTIAGSPERLYRDGETSFRGAYYFDGLGRLTKITEPIPSGESGTYDRSRVFLDFFFNGSDSCSGPYGSDLANRRRIKLESEWIEGSDTSNCSLLHWTETEFDGLGRQAIVTRPDNSEVFTEHIGDRIVMNTRTVATGGGSETPLSKILTSDAVGRLIQLEEEVSPNSFYSSSFEYNINDELKRVVLQDDTESQERVFTYSDAAGFRTESSEPERTTEYRSYDALGNMLEELTGGTVTEYEYDTFGRIKGKTIGENPASAFMYGDSYPAEDPMGIGVPGYNQLVRSEQYNWFGSHAVLVSHDWSHGETVPGARIGMRETAISGVGTNADYFTVEYGYDRWGNVSEVVHPWWSWSDECESKLIQRRRFDGPWFQGLDIEIGDEIADKIVEGVTYHANGRPRKTSFGPQGGGLGYLEEFADDNGMPRPEGYDFHFIDGVGGTVIQRWHTETYEYDGSGNIKGITNIQTSLGKTYSYDGLNRLVEYSVDGEPVESYSYDRFGNLTTFNSIVFDVDSATNRISRIGGLDVAEAWDDRGNLTWIPSLGANHEQSLAFSKEDRLIESSDMTSGVRWRYGYDTSGERVLRWLIDPSNQIVDVRFTLRDEGGKALSDWLLTPGSSFGPSRAYLYAGDRLVSQLEWSFSGIIEKFIAADHLGSTRFTAEGYNLGGRSDPGDGREFDYLPFGEFDPLSDDPDTTHLFTGHERDLGEYSTGLDYMHARYYSSNLGRFLSVDPVGGSAGSSQSWNRYSYVLNNPVKLVDPNGETALVFTVGPGNDLFEKFGHSAVFVISPSGDHAGISYGGGHDFHRGVAEFVRAYNAEGRDVAMTVLDTTPEQDAQMIDFLRTNPEGGTNRDAFGANEMIRENCAQAVGNTLEAGGVFPVGTNPSQVLGGALSPPGALLESLQGLEINLGTIVLQPDSSQERKDFLQFFLGIGGPDDEPRQ